MRNITFSIQTQKSLNEIPTSFITAVVDNSSDDQRIAMTSFRSKVFSDAAYRQREVPLKKQGKCQSSAVLVSCEHRALWPGGCKVWPPGTSSQLPSKTRRSGCSDPWDGVSRPIWSCSSQMVQYWQPCPRGRQNGLGWMVPCPPAAALILFRRRRDSSQVSGTCSKRFGSEGRVSVCLCSKI